MISKLDNQFSWVLNEQPYTTLETFQTKDACFWLFEHFYLVHDTVVFCPFKMVPLKSDNFSLVCLIFE